MAVDLFTCPEDQVDAQAVAAFVLNAIEARVQAESLVLEFKRENDGSNAAKAVAAMANTDGGLVIVGVDESSGSPLTGITRKDADAVVQSLRTRLPDVMPEVIPVAIPDVDERLLLVVRVDADAVDRPVVLNGRVMKRSPGHTSGARRDEIVALCNETRGTGSGSSAVSGVIDAARFPMWGDDKHPTCDVRVIASFNFLATLPTASSLVRRRCMRSRRHCATHQFPASSGPNQFQPLSVLTAFGTSSRRLPCVSDYEQTITGRSRAGSGPTSVGLRS